MKGKNELLKICRALFEKLPQDKTIALHFCYKCKQVVFYGKNDICNSCSTEFLAELGNCPKCDSDNTTPLCSNCGHEIDCDYLSDFLYWELIDIEWLWIEDLRTIIIYLFEEYEKYLLADFFKFFRDNGENHIGLTIEQFIELYLKAKNGNVKKS